MTVMANAFRLSRVYAEGWMAARPLHPAGEGPVANPYPAEPEHRRWDAGFNDALAEKPSAANSPPAPAKKRVKRGG